jgi:acetylglutamate kinase
MSFTSASEDGKVTRDDRLTNYSPAFKRTLITQALDYIARFAGTRAVIKYGGAAMVKDSLKASFARDVNLLRTAGLLPVVVHGGGPELERALAHFGPADQASGRGVSERNRTASEADQELMEMVLSGRINSELVSLLNQEKAWAVGLSGKDAGFLRAKRSEDSAAREAELETVDRTIVEVLLDKGYVPVVSPVALGNDGGTYPVNADDAAADIARALGAEKLIYVTDVPGVLQDGELLSEMDGEHARTLIGSGVIHGGMRTKIEAGLRALAGGVRSVHVIDGRTPHGLIAELFTERGVGTLLRADAHREGERKS